MTLFVYGAVVVLMMTGFYVVMATSNLVKKIMGLGIFQASVFLLYICIGKVSNGTAPILTETEKLYSNPLPHVLILTAIVVGVATTALGLALIVRIHGEFDSINEEEIADILNSELKHDTLASVNSQGSESRL